jgi:hypothetical protein
VIEAFADAVSQIGGRDIRTETDKRTLVVRNILRRLRRGARHPCARHFTDRSHIRRQIDGQERSALFVPRKLAAGLIEQSGIRHALPAENQEVTGEFAILRANRRDVRGADSRNDLMRSEFGDHFDARVAQIRRHFIALHAARDDDRAISRLIPCR